jgi:ThiF family
MSQRLIDHNQDLKRLRDEGYTVEVRQGFLLVHRIHYVNELGAVELGTLVSPLHMSGETVLAPDNHVAHFIGGQPCHKDGRPIQQIMHQAAQTALDANLVVDRSFSNKPPEGYRDYHHKMSTYANIISGPAQSIDPANDPRQFIAIKSDDEESVFNYVDTASSRAGVKALTRKLELGKVALIGLGGTGSYILDLVAKTPVREIHLFDGDRFFSHNAFRSPGAASLEELEQQQFKVERFRDIYSKMRRGIVANPFPIHCATESHLDGIEFAFVSIDGGESKQFVLEALERRGIPYIDCGMGVEEIDGKLTGQVRVTTSAEGFRSHVWEKNAISFAGEDVGNEYSRNIQIADLNALNAALAVIRWKRMVGFYLDLEREYHSLYPIDGNIIVNAYHDEPMPEAPIEMRELIGEAA